MDDDAVHTHKSSYIQLACSLVLLAAIIGTVARFFEWSKSKVDVGIWRAMWMGTSDHWVEATDYCGILHEIRQAARETSTR